MSGTRLPFRSNSFDVLNVLRELDGPLSEDELVQRLNQGTPRRNVRKALRYLEEQREIVKAEPDGLWALKHRPG